MDAASPFAQLIDPKALQQRLARCERLGHLKRRVCRPLDKPLIPHAGRELRAEAIAV